MAVVLRSTVGSVFSHVQSSIWDQINQAAVYQKPPLGALRGPWTACQSPRQSASRPLPTFELIITGRLSLAWLGPVQLPSPPPNTSQPSANTNTNKGRTFHLQRKQYLWKASLPLFCPLWPLFIHFHKLHLGLLVLISLSDSPGFSPLNLERLVSRGALAPG